MRALVTGASGFIGSNLMDRLLAAAAQVKCLVCPRSNLTWLSSQHLTLSDELLDITLKAANLIDLGGISWT